MREILGREINALAAETELHWNTVYKWARTPEKVSQATRYALASAAEKIGIDLAEPALKVGTPKKRGAVIRPFSAARSDVVDVFAHWKDVMNSPRSKLDLKRGKLILARLEEGSTLDDLKQVATNISQDKWHMGDNDRHRKFNSIALIYRDAGKVDEYLALSHGSDDPQDPEMLARVAKYKAEEEKRVQA